MKKLLIGMLALASFSTFASEYVCFASKYPTDMVHTFEDGWVTLKVNSEEVNLKAFYKSNGTTKKWAEAVYKLVGIKGGKSSTTGMYVGKLDITSDDFPGDSIYEIFFDKSLIENEKNDSIKVVGKFTFSGHGYSYDWNSCYNKKY